MTLAKLKEKIDNSIEYAEECGVDPQEVDVSLQLFIWDGKDATGGNTYWANDKMKVHYDNNGTASGCVITANKITE